MPKRVNTIYVIASAAWQSSGSTIPYGLPRRSTPADDLGSDDSSVIVFAPFAQEGG